MGEIEAGSLAMNTFETIKTDFNGLGGNTWYFDFNLNAPETDPTFSNQRRRHVVLQSEDIRGLYEPVLSRIFDLIVSQISAANEKCRRRVINVSDSHPCFVGYL